MFRAFRTARTNATTACLVLAASLIGVGMVPAQSVNPSLTFRNNASLKISVKVDKIGYREDIDPGGSQSVPSSMLQNVDPTDTGIVWEAYPADLKSPQQKDPNAKCDGGTINFDSKGNAVIEVRGSCS
jgi:hypothetical protein